jgi:hypothetical protein
MVMGELVCGTSPFPRAQTQFEIGLLRSVKQALIAEVMELC